MIEKTAPGNEVKEQKRTGLYQSSSDSTLNNSMEPHEGLDMQTIINEYKSLNESFIQAMDFILDMVSRKELTDADFQTIHQLDFKYQKWEINSRDAMNMDKGIFTTILHGTLSETFEKSLLFFGNVDAHKWNLKQDEYNTFFIKLGGVHFRNMIQVVDKLYSNLKELYFDYKRNDNRFDRYFNFEEYTEKADEIVDLDDRKKFFIQAMHDCKKLCSSKTYFDNYGNDCMTFISKCKNAIEIINSELEIIPNSPSEETFKNKDFTTKRQVLALHYLLNEVGCKTGSVDRTVQARFIEFMTGKNYDKIYKILSEPFKGLENTKNTSAIEDMEYIKNQFDKLGLKIITNKITGDMNI